MEKQTPGMIRRESRVSKSSMLTPLPWVSSPIEWPVRCVNCSPKPARVITPRETSSTSAPRIDLPARIFLRTKSTAESRASRTMLKMREVLFRHTFADVTSPGLVGRDRVGFAQFRSRIDQDEIAALDWRVLILCRHVMRIGSVRVHRHNHRLLLHPFLLVATRA